MTKSTGIVRKLDELGRIVIPKELRRTHDINEGDPLEFFVDGDRIILKKYAPGCSFCGSVEAGRTLHGKLICGACVTALQG